MRVDAAPGPLAGEEEGRGRAHRLLRTAPVWASLVVLAISAGVLAGWHLGIPLLKSVLPGHITMKANTAVGFAALAIAVLALRQEPVGRGRRIAGGALLLLTAALATLTLCEYLFGANLGIDELLYPDPEGAGRFPPGRLAPITAVNFLLLAGAIARSHVRARPTFRTAQLMALLAFLVGFQGLVGYALGTTYTFGVAFYTQMAVHTTVLFVLVSVAVLTSRRGEGLMAVMTSPSAGGVLARNLIGWAVVAPPLVGFVALVGEKAGLYDANFTTLLRVVGNSVFFAALVWRNAAALHAVDVQRRSAERAREGLYAAAQQAIAARDEAIRARDEFLSLASHELKTPLTPLRLRVQQLRRFVQVRGAATLPASEVLAVTERFDHYIARLSGLVESLLETSRLSAGDLALAREEVPVGDAVDASVTAVAHALARAGCAVRVEVPRGLTVFADRERLERALTNLLLNAAHHAAGSPVVVRVLARPGAVVFEVQDRGPGVPAEARERIFRRFERASTAEHPASGLGLGLYLARQIARAHGGELSVRSEAGLGATFVLELPAPERFDAAGARADAEPTAPGP